MNRKIYRALTIAGSDSGGGAGIQADLKTFALLGVYGTSVVTAVTAQNTVGIEAVQVLPADMVLAQLRAVATDLFPVASKTGMLGEPQVVEAVAATIKELRVPNLVVDPVMTSKGGQALLDAQARRRLVADLFPLALVCMPNLDEAESLLGKEVRTLRGMRDAALLLHDLGPKWVVIKGGHLSGAPVDLVFDGESFYELPGRRAPCSPHGTGCTFSAALTAGLARGLGVLEALTMAKQFVEQAVINAQQPGSGYPTANLNAAAEFVIREKGW